MKKSDVLLLRRLMRHRKSQKGLAGILLDESDYAPRTIAHTKKLFERDRQRERTITKEARRRGRKDSSLRTVLKKIGIE